MKTLFVCTGNICRSPTAEAVLRHRIKESVNIDDAAIIIDSAGTHGYHVGSPPDSRARQVAKRRGVATDNILARKITVQDFCEFDQIIAMDRGHYHFLDKMMPPDATAELSLFSDYCSQFNDPDVPDPYYDDIQAFEDVFDIVDDGVAGLIKKYF